MMNKYIDHTALKPNVTKVDIKKLCDEALKYDFASVCVEPYYVKYAAELLAESDVKVCTVIGFPLGANTVATKVLKRKMHIKTAVKNLIWLSMRCLKR